VARRVLDSTYLSIEALNRLIYPGSAIVLVHGFHAAFGRVLRVMGAGLGIAICAALAVYLLAPLMPVLFGSEYTSMVGFTQALSFVVIPVAIAAIALEAFGAAGWPASPACLRRSTCSRRWWRWSPASCCGASSKPTGPAPRGSSRPNSRVREAPAILACREPPR
jgi:hypothetical protein